MAKFKIVELVREERIVEAESAQEALDSYIQEGHDGEVGVNVESRHVEDESGNVCEAEEN